eukprot:3580657-Pleurochrysis_carterae.AAC.1
MPGSPKPPSGSGTVTTVPPQEESPLSSMQRRRSQTVILWHMDRALRITLDIILRSRIIYFCAVRSMLDTRLRNLDSYPRYYRSLLG